MKRITLSLLACLVLVSCGRAETPAVAEPVSYYREIRPIFQAHCHGCHQPAKASGSYVMTNPESLRANGDSEQPAIVPGSPEVSHLLSQITPDEDGVAAMPQDGNPLENQEIELIRQWIAQGAVDDTPPKTQRQYDTQHPPEYTRPPVITALDFSSDGQLLAVAGFHEVLLHRLDDEHSSAEPTARLIGMSERIESVAFSPDGKRLAVTGGRPAQLGEVQIWNVADRELLVSLPVTSNTVYGASWSPDGKLLSFGATDSTVRAINSESGEQVLYQGAHSDWVLDTVFSADGSHLVSVGRDMTAKLIDVQTQRFVDNVTSITPGALRGGINAVARHPDRDEILFGGADGTPKIYQMHRTTKRVIGDDANLLWRLPPLPGRVFSVDYSTDGRVIAAGSSLNGKGAIHLYGIDPAPEISAEITAILVKPTHSRSDAERDKLKQHFADGIQVIAQISVKTGGIYAVSISPDSRHVAAAGSDGIVRLVDTESGQITREFIPVDVVEAPDRTALVATDDTARNQVSAASPSAPQVNESLPVGAEVIRLSIQPPSIQLHAVTDYVQTIVSAELSDGRLVDVTRLADLQTDSSAIQISSTGVVSGTSNATGTLTAELVGKSTAIPVDISRIDSPHQADYIQDVSPILARAGCNAGTCHGAQDGKGGFKLSLRGYDPVFDVRALADDLSSRRVNLASPAQSLMLLKPTANVPHEGGQVLDADGNYYRTILNWIESGAPLDTQSSRVAKVEIQPVNPAVEATGSRQQMRVVATFTNGQQRDVTREAFVESADTEIARPVAGNPGMIEVLRRGETAVLVRYEGAYVATTITVMGDRTGFIWNDPPANNNIDILVNAKLERTKTSVSPLCDDYTFVRRVYLDLTGLPPDPDQLRDFLDDARDSRWKRNELIDRLIGSPEFVEHWANRWADLLQVNSKFLGRAGAESFRNWIRGEIEANTRYDEFARKILTASGSTKEHPAASYFKILRDPEVTMENTTHLFLATRFNCNKCHDHPFERWTQNQYYELSAYFARVGIKKDPASGTDKVGGTAVESAKPLYEIVFTEPDGEVQHQQTGNDVAPRFPFECEHDCDEEATRREQLASWITSPDNPYFATSYANRIWAYLTGRGLIEPIDDLRAGNPPTNPELLDWLADQFVQSGFDTQHLIRTICRSRAYQLSLASNRFNEDDHINYSHARARRLPAEVLYDAIYRATGAKSQFPGVAPGTRAAALPDVGIRLPDGFLTNLGRAARESACECERSSELQMGPVMALINGATVSDAISDPAGTIAALVASQPDDRALLGDLYLRILNRRAQDDEIDDALEVIGQIDQEHQLVVKTLDDYQQQLGPIIEQRQAQRDRQLAAKKKELTAYEQKIAPERKRLADERTERIATAREALQTVRSALLEELPAWETKHRTDTVWEPVNPIELSGVFGQKLKVLDDRSVFLTGLNGHPSSTRLVAPVDLTGITGIKIDALTDDRLPNRGPGRNSDGNFVLTELQVEAGHLSQSPPPLIRAWDFAAAAEGWTAHSNTELEIAEGRLIVRHDEQKPMMMTQISSPAGPSVLEITALVANDTNLKVWWQTTDEPHFDDSRKAERKVTPGTESWRTYRIHFRPKSEVTKLRLQLDGAGKEVSLDSIRVIQANAPELQQVKLQNAQADFSQDSFPVATAIDGKLDGNDNGWAVAPQGGQDHVATFETTDEFTATGPGLLRVEMLHKFSSGNHGLGRFRIAVTRSPRPVSFGLPASINQILVLDRTQRSDEQQTELIDYYLNHAEGFVDHQMKLTKAEKPVPPDAGLAALKERVTELGKPLPEDSKLVILRRAVELSETQLTQKRLTAAQDISWALINSPEFLYNH